MSSCKPSINIALLMLCLVMILAGCKKNSAGSEGEINKTDRTYGLFLSLSNDARGLYILNIQTGAAARAGDGHAAGSTGLAGKGAEQPLFGASDFSLYEIALDGSDASLIGDPAGQAFTEGLAYNPEEDVLYASSNGFLHLRSPATGETIETILSPPNQPDIEGLAFDPEAGTLFGLARGFESQPQFQRGLYILNVDAPKNSWIWESVGDTGGLWADAGLAFEPQTKMLFAIGRIDDPSGIYSIDPSNGISARIGDTGLAEAKGGLAWVPAN